MPLCRGSSDGKDWVLKRIKIGKDGYCRFIWNENGFYDEKSRYALGSDRIN
jgi:hypothetical protein